MHSLVERSVNCAERLLALYEDKDGQVSNSPIVEAFHFGCMQDAS